MCEGQFTYIYKFGCHLYGTPKPKNYKHTINKKYRVFTMVVGVRVVLAFSFFSTFILGFTFEQETDNRVHI